MLQAPFAVASFVPWIGFALALVARLVLWQAWRRRIRPAARAVAAIDAAGSVFKIASLVALGIAVVVVVLPLAAPAERALQVLGGVLAIGGGLWFKFTLVTRGGFNQGFAISHLPVRGVPRRSET
jgi:phenylacetyl-CoA:acceptor oxidoreductase subunit 2